MAFWMFMTVMNALIPLTLLGFGKGFVENPPEEINHLFGYRTTMSMKNEETWVFAHHYCGRLWVVMGRIMLGLTIAAMLVVFGEEISVVGTFGGIVSGVQVGFLLGSIYATEKALQKKFDMDGHKR